MVRGRLGGVLGELEDVFEGELGQVNEGLTGVGMAAIGVEASRVAMGDGIGNPDVTLGWKGIWQANRRIR